MEDLRNYIHPDTPAYREQERTRKELETTSDALLIQNYSVMSKVAALFGISACRFRENVNKAPRGVPAYVVIKGHLYRLQHSVTKAKK